MSNISSLKFKIRGTAPLLVHNCQGVDALNHYAIAKKQVTSKRKKTEADLAELTRLDFMSALYWDDRLGPYMPSANIERCIQNGAAKNRKQKEFKAAAFVSEPRIPIKTTKQFSSMDGMFDYAVKNKQFILRTPVVVQRARVMATYPEFPAGWELEFNVEFDNTTINEADVKEAVETAGKLCGIGAWRPKYGRFEVVS